MNELNELQEAFENGKITEFQYAAKITEIEKDFETALKRAKLIIINEFEKYQKEELKCYGFTIVQKQNYSMPKNWQPLNEAKEKAKNLEQLVKNSYISLQVNGIQLIDENGELIPLPEITVSKYYQKSK